MQLHDKLTQLQAFSGIYTILLFLVFIAGTLALGSMLRHYYNRIKKSNTNNLSQRIIESLVFISISGGISLILTYQLLSLLLEINR